MTELEVGLQKLKELELAGEWPPSIKFKSPGDQVTGTLLRWGTGQAIAGEAPIATLLDANDGELCSVWITQAGLKAEMERKNPKPGEKMTVRYIGEKISKATGAIWKQFAVVMLDRDEGETTDFLTLIGKAPPRPPHTEPTDESDPFEDENAGSMPYVQHTMGGR